MKNQKDKKNKKHKKQSTALMDLGFEDTGFQLVTNVEIPDIFYRRFQTGISELDQLFSAGFLPSSTFTITAGAGTGKTTLMLQMLEALAINAGKRVAYATGEESIFQLAFTCERLGLTHIKIANRTDIDKLAEDMKNYDFLICDSFQCMRSAHIDKPAATEKYVIKTICDATKEHECVVGIIMHLTKQGKLKGNSLIPHTVDMNIEMRVGDEEIYGDNCTREITISKNRFGPCNDAAFIMGSKGFIFDQPVKLITQVETQPVVKKRTNLQKENEFDQILQRAVTGVRLNEAVEITGNFYRGKNHLNELVALGKLRKVGRGVDAIWMLP